MIRRELFRKGYEFVAVKPLKVTSAIILNPGEKLDKSVFRLFHLRSLYAKRSIGVLDSEWANKMLSEIASKLEESKPKLEKKFVANGKQSKKKNNL